VRAGGRLWVPLLSLWRPDLGTLSLSNKPHTRGQEQGQGQGQGWGWGQQQRARRSPRGSTGFRAQQCRDVAPPLPLPAQLRAVLRRLPREGDPDIFGINALDISPPPKGQVTKTHPMNSLWHCTLVFDASVHKRKTSPLW